MYSLEFDVKCATNLPNVEITGKSDPYVLLEYQGTKVRTKHIEDELNPKWNEKLTIDLNGQPLSASENISIAVKDYDKITPDKTIAKAEVPTKGLLSGNHQLDLKLPLKGKGNKETTAVLELTIVYRSPSQSSPGGGGDGGGTVVGGGGGGGEVGGESSTGVAMGGGPMRHEAGGGVSTTSPQASTRRTQAPYSTKVQNFQVRVRIVEARQLMGSNIPPICKVTCTGHMKETRVKSVTNSPYWNESFFYNYRDSAANIFPKMITFGVYHSKKLRKDALIGSFEVDLGFIFEQENQCIINKWLLLSTPGDPSSGGKGYLKVSVVILGPDDEVPNMEPKSSEDEDIESNLLRPAGVQLRPAIFKLYLYGAEDLPRMDPDTLKGIKNIFSSNDEEKKYVDPFVIAQYAGSKLQTEKKKENDHPDWNSLMILNFKFPSMCDDLKLTCYDWDAVGSNDAISTAILKMSNISALRDDDDGFLPTFGPAYINMYGSPREYQAMPDKITDLNLGKGDGAAYRGRLFVQLKTELLEQPTRDEVKPIDAETIAVVKKHLRRRNYRLFAGFLSAGIFKKNKSDPIEFEVSIGNYGNILDDDVPPCASTTPPTNPIYDGEAFCSLPWNQDKPCVVVDSQWEDISHRLGAVNLLLRLARIAEIGVIRIKSAIKYEISPEEKAHVAITSLDKFILGLNKPLPDWSPDNIPENDLDKHVKKLRENYLKTLKASAIELRETADAAEDVLSSLQNYQTTLINIANEPQQSFPDVIIWMLVGGKRYAYHRIPAYNVLYDPDTEYSGLYCAVPQDLILKKPRLYSDDEEDYLAIPGEVRVVVWLGLENYQYVWHQATPGCELQVLAEVYENEGSIAGHWVKTKPPLTRHAWSDVTGKHKLKKEIINPPPGWKWNGDWFVDPETSVFIRQDAGRSSFVDEVYYCESRTPDTDWVAAQVPYCSLDGTPTESPKEIVLPEGWQWEGDWEVDKSCGCDEEGFQYAVVSTDEDFTPVEKLTHMYRRQCFTRKRVLGEAGMAAKLMIPSNIASQKQEERLSLLGSMKTDTAENWEYSSSFNSKFHRDKKFTDNIRRRRWHRKLAPINPDFSGTKFLMTLGITEDEDGEDKKKMKNKGNLTVPRVYLHFQSFHTWELRVYLYQARDLLSTDQSGLADPFVRCAFQGFCQSTEKQENTICPKYDQTLIFENLPLFGEPDVMLKHSPPILIEIWDWDKVGKNEFMGRVEVHPFVVLNAVETNSCRLKWYGLQRGLKDAGELLAASELILIDNQPVPQRPPMPDAGFYTLPEELRPKLCRKGVEILSWGVRNMTKYHLSSVNSPSIEFEIDGHVAVTEKIKDVESNPNFTNPQLFIDAMLPMDPEYMPPLNIKVRDHRAFGQKPTVGMRVIRNVAPYMREPRTSKHDPILDIPALSCSVPVEMLRMQQTAPGVKEEKHKTTKKKYLDLEQLDEEIDWYSKYYASLGQWDKCLKYRDSGYDTIEVHEKELEKVDLYGGFTDFCDTMTLYKSGKCDRGDENFAGEFKGAIRIYDLPANPKEAMPIKYFDKLPTTSDTEECILRVYIINATGLQPADPSGLADPFVEVKVGNKRINSKERYKPNTLNPEFGELFELKCLLPVEKDLRVRIVDYDVVGANDVMGETSIDLENRRLSKLRATCGLPQTYSVSGPNQWRDSCLPTQLLTDVLDQLGLPPPQWKEADELQSLPTCRVGKKEFTVEEFEEHNEHENPHLGPVKERLALHILNVLPLVKEHVETRSLTSSVQSDIDQGKVLMWVDIFPVKVGPPGPPFDITPRKPNEYVLRIVVWNTFDVILQESNIFGEKMSDIYVKGWLSGVDEHQKTDVHYRSLNGEGNFNWRFVFPFNYIPSENMVVIQRKEHFWSLDATESRVPPSLIMQVWDNDKFNPDDFLGTLELKLSHMPAPAKSRKSCTEQLVQSVKSDHQIINLFDCKRIKGYWPFVDEKDGQQVLTGKIEMEMEVLPKVEEIIRPAGRARDEPNLNPTLKPPNRPPTSFFWFTSPWKSCKFIIWKRMKWCFIITLLVIVFGLLLVLFVYAVPELLARKMVGV